MLTGRFPSFLLLMTVLPAFMPSASSCAQDLSPLRNELVWLPMTGVTEEQMADARRAGYTAMMLKIHPPLTKDGMDVDFNFHETVIRQAKDHDLKLVLAILGWVGLGDGQYWDVEENGSRIPNQLDPFWPEAMEHVEWYYNRVIDHYKDDASVIAFAPTWGIYGEAGFTTQSAGRSSHALARFNEWREKQSLPPLDILPTRTAGPNTEFNRFIRFRFLYLEEQFDAMVKRLKDRAGQVPVGMWQELYPVAGYLWNMVEVPSADFGLYESCFTYQTTHHPEKCLAETMGFRYRCRSAQDYANYYLPLLARKRGEGQRFMGCQLSNDYAKNYGWTEEDARKMGFDQWEDAFGPTLGKLLDAPLESPVRDVLLVFPTYAAAALSGDLRNEVDAKLIDVLLRQYGCQMVRYGSPRLDKLSVEEMNRFRLIIIPAASYLIPETWEKLKQTKSNVLFTGCFAQAFNGEQVFPGENRRLDKMFLRYRLRPAGNVTASGVAHPLTRDLRQYLSKKIVSLPGDEIFKFETEPSGVKVLLKCGDEPLLSTLERDRMIFIHGQFFAGLCHNPQRKPPQELSGSKDASANEVDPWGPYDAAHPQNPVAMALMKNILDHAGVDYRVPDPDARCHTPYLGDHMEPISISANIAYNNMAEPRKITIRLPWKPSGVPSVKTGSHYEAILTLPPFSYQAIKGFPDRP